MDYRTDMGDVKKVVQHLVEVFKNIPRDSDLEIVIDMMKEITFDDPGLFLRRSINDEEELLVQEGVVLWLIHQFMYVISCDDYVKSKQKTLEIQKRLLSACYIKQNWLFSKLIERYVQFTFQVSNIDASFKEPFIVDAFHFEKFKEMSLIPSDYPSRIICIKNLSILKLFAMCNIKILTHTISLIINSDELLMRRCTEALLQFFDYMDFDIKILVIEFLLEETAHYNSGYWREINRILLQCLEIVNSKTEQWNIGDQLPAFERIIINFLSDESKQYTICQNTEDCTRVFDFCFGIIQSKRKIRTVNYENLIACAYRCLQLILKKQTTSTQLEKVHFFVVARRNVTAESLKLMEYSIVEDSKRNSSSYIWVFGCHLAEQILNQWENAERMCEIEDKITLFTQLLEVTLRIQNNFIAWHQRKHLYNVDNLKCETCSSSTLDKNQTIAQPNIVTTFAVMYPTLLDNIEVLANRFVTIVNKSRGLRRLMVSNIAILLLSIWNSNGCNGVIENLLDLSTCIFGFYDNTKILDTEFLNVTINPEDIVKTIHRLVNIRIPIPSKISSAIHTVLLREKIFCNVCISLIIKKTYNIRDIIAELFSESISKDSSFELMFSKIVKSLICLTSHKCNAVLNVDKDYEYSVICSLCDDQVDEYCNGVILPIEFNDSDILSDQHMEQILKLFHSNELRVRLNMINCLPVICSRHSQVLCSNQNLFWTNLFDDDLLEIKLELTKVIERVMDILHNSNLDNTTKDFTIQTCLEKLLKATTKSLKSDDKNQQSCVVELIGKFASTKTASERTLLMCFRKMLFFLINPKSVVAANAILCAEKMCRSKGIKPKRLYNWYKENILNVVVKLAVSVYLEYGLVLGKSLCNFNEMLGNSNLKRDLMKNDFPIISAMVLPWAIKYPTCRKLLENICELTNLHIDLLLGRAFTHIYVYLHIHEPPMIAEKCLQFITEQTGKSISYFLKSNSKRSLSEVLLSYHKQPELATNTIRILLNKDEGPINEDISIDSITRYLTARFLGVLNSFGTILMTTNFEKKFQKYALRSLGDIIRFIGTKYITPFRFKILELLNSVRTLGIEDLTNLCVSIWKIFIYTVDISKLGPLLSTILVMLEPFLETQHANEVNELLKFLIISNGSLINRFISDLFFLEMTQVCDEIKIFVAEHSQKYLVHDTFLKKLKLYSKEINHENVANVGVRIYGLNYLSDLFCRNRDELHDLIFGQQQINPIIENLLENLMEGCKHVDENLQIASAICLGNLGAIEPSLLSKNYAPESYFALSIHTDTFSIMALSQLCRAYQSQKNTHLVDAFSLAIQEILVTRGVDPKKNKKMDVWNSIPEKIRPLMEPFLTSCYTALDTKVPTDIHPIFGSTNCLTPEYWAFNWSLNMISMITDEQTKNLLTSFKPSMKNHTGILLMFLPYVFIHGLQCATDNDVKKIEEELQCVFDAVLCPLTNDSIDCLSVKCAKIATNQLDFLDRWICHYQNSNMSKGDEPYLRALKFSTIFHPKLLAKVNFACKENAKALMSLELFLHNEPSQLQSELTFLLEINAELLDTDSMEGILALKDIQTTLAEQILFNNMTGRQLESTVVFENIMQIGDINENNVNGIIQCYLGLNQPEIALRVAESLMNQFSDKKIDPLIINTAEPLWRLGRFKELDEQIKDVDIDSNQNWGVQCGRVLLNFTKGQFDEYTKSLNNCRLSVLKQLQTTGCGKSDYNTRYPIVSKLHLITEMESAQEMFNEFVGEQDVDASTNILQILFRLWDDRIKIMQPTARILEPVLCLRRILLIETKKLFQIHVSNENVRRNGEILIDRYIGESYMKSIELARNAEMYQQAQLFILNAEVYSPPGLFIEKTKHHWVRGEQTSCLHILNRGIEEMEKLGGKNLHPLIYAEAKFLYADYNAKSKNSNPSANQKYFKLAIQALQSSEKCYVHLAQYQDKIFAAMADNEKSSKQGLEMQQAIMTHYGKSMMYGVSYVFHSMPRFLSIWLDFYNFNKNESYKTVAQGINLLVERFSERLPAFVFFTAFSQLVSRISHPLQDVYQVIKTIIIKLILQFPQQSLWMILMVYKSSYINRVKRCSEIFMDKRLATKSIQKLIQDFNSLAEILITLTNQELIKTEPRFSVKEVCSALPKFLNDTSRSPILLPSEKLMNPVLPGPYEREKLDNYNAFPHDAVYIQNIRDQILVLPSLQRPKRITLVGSDGNDYMIMMKPKDDLRKDFRLMEFNAVVKQYLRQEQESRQRRLYIRTYAVVPLNEDCGIIEWIPDLDAFRTIVCRIMKRKNLGMTSREKSKAMCAKSDSIEKKRSVFVNVLLEKHPPVFREWFIEKFTTPHNWYQARSSFIRTTAVMSMVGYILGLGDRHGENILFDSTNGDTIHVDFNCLFNKGEQFEFPELVPFRLTHNMVHAMGPLGVEGMFRKCCEITLKVLQKQMPTLMSVLKPFVYDPLVEWSKKTPSSSTTMERTDPQAMNNVHRIEERLKGLIKTNGNRNVSNIPLSVEGVVKHCITEAIDVDKLASMFFGWAGYM